MIRVNNRDDVEWREGMTVSDILEQFRYTYPHLVVKVDGTVVQEAAYDTYAIPDGADVRVIHLIAGG
ncbi:MAG TPA: sulfur carrier protein ThiS [Chloroflexi bacterium]|nr:sulfur carrier protein ThiS [Chloroflexota bacterium]